jgi:hypothetical protein
LVFTTIAGLVGLVAASLALYNEIHDYFIIACSVLLFVSLGFSFFRRRDLSENRETEAKENSLDFK